MMIRKLVGLAVLALVCISATGCTLKFTGEASLMQQWDRPKESAAPAPTK